MKKLIYLLAVAALGAGACSGTGASDLRRRPLRLFRPEVRRDRALLVQDDAREGRAHDSPCGGDREPHSPTKRSVTNWRSTRRRPPLRPGPTISIPIRSSGRIVLRRNYVRVRKTDIMDEKEVDIANRIVEGGAYRPAPTSNSLRIIRVFEHHLPARLVERRFRRRLPGRLFGRESTEEFIKATGVSDLSDMDNSEISALCRQFVYYLRELRDNGNEVLERTAVRCSTESISTAIRCEYEVIWHISRRTVRRCGPGNRLLRG